MAKAMDLLRKNLAAAIENLRWSDTRLAEEMGKTPQEISRYRNGKGALGIDKLDALAAALKTTPARLLAAPSEMIEHELPECVRRVSDAALGGAAPVRPGERPATEFLDDLALALGSPTMRRAIQKLLLMTEAESSKKPA